MVNEFLQNYYFPTWHFFNSIPDPLESTIIRQYLEVDYPKLVRLYGDLWRRLEGITVEMMSTTPDLSPIISSSHNTHNGEELNEGSEKSQNFE